MSKVNRLSSRTETSKAKYKILVVDDHPMTREGLAHLVNKQADMVVCGEAGNPAEAFDRIRQLKPDLVLADLTMPGRSGVEFIKDLVAVHGNIPVLVVSMHDETIYAERVLKAGARGYIMKEAGGERLLEAIRSVLGGKVYVSGEISSRILDQLSGRNPRGSTSPIQKLSDREFEVFQLLGLGLSTREIGEKLNLSPKTVDVYRGHLKIKLDVRDATALVRYAVRWVESGGQKQE